MCNHNNPYNLDIIFEYKEYLKIVKKNPDNELIDIEKAIDNIVLDIRYATKNNFTGEILYSKAKALAIRPVVLALKSIQKELLCEGFGLKIFDTYRPYSATFRLYELNPTPGFTAAPYVGSKHNRGCAIDLTIVDLKTKHEIQMPTEFDDFTEKAHINYNNLPDNIKENRLKLITIMTKNNFEVNLKEWWHFHYRGWENYKILDISFEELML